ncbi:1-propanol dehydrogenase PduQ [Brevibacillus ginsengisoli]|uniref:1-propanol dehydrogenase PduQ n=1 Tax=Brevibacillus ginsengisoli TaxID=363854 RepID=UPI003CE8A2C3
MAKISFKTDIYLGTGSLERLSELNGQNIFVVTDPFMVKSGMIDRITDKIAEKNQFEVFDDIVPDPPIETIVGGVSKLMAFRADVIIALGGGSAIDAAKAIKDFARKISGLNSVRFIAIPTTSGTGSEVTSFSVITDQAKKTKYPLVSDEFLPEEAILDPELVKSVPDFITADTGMDVLTHAIEAYVSTDANDIADALAEKAVQFVFEFLPRAYQNGNDMEAREKMHNASCMAGMAFNLTSLGLNHGIAHVAGAKLHIPHGRMNALLLPYVIEYNAELKGFADGVSSAAAIKYAKLAKMLGLSASNPRVGVRSLINAITSMQKRLNMPTTFRACKLDYAQVEEAKMSIAEGALLDGCTKTNPRTPTKEDVIGILNKLSQ